MPAHTHYNTFMYLIYTNIYDAGLLFHLEHPLLLQIGNEQFLTFQPDEHGCHVDKSNQVDGGPACRLVEKFIIFN